METMSPQGSSSINNPQDNLTNFIYDLQYFANLDSENKICFDCGGPFPTYVSINNGVFICSNCANNHSKLGYNISFIHAISSPWDPYLLSYATRGGNSRFKRLCNQYEVPCQSYNENDDQKLNKYIIRLGEYHRLVLRSEILADEPPPPLYLEIAKNKCDLNIIYFPEFQNYHLYKGEVVVPGKQYSIGGKIWNGTKTTAKVVGAAGGLVYKVGKPVICFLGKGTYKGLKFLGSSIYNHYFPDDGKNKNNYGNNNNINGGKINNSNFNNNNIGNDFALVDYSDEDLKQIKTMNLNNYSDNNLNNNYNQNNTYNNQYNNSNGYNNNDKYNNIYTIDGNENYSNNIQINNKINFQQFNNFNNHQNIITNDKYNYIINDNNQQINIKEYNKKESNNSIKNVININDNNSFDTNGFEILNHLEKDSNSLFENNSYAGMNVKFENTDQKKARRDANNFLLKP